ncbi:MAG: phosphatidylglycerophosphatase A [Paracoccaceae bacterium]|nr:phosphatidylglycerophosphatase A [Paracoccaceae bacterium]
MVKLYVTLLGLGLAPFAPGTLGSLAGILLWLIIREVISPGAMLFTVVFLFFFSWIITENYIKQKKGGEHDPSEVIIDELIGQWISLIPILYLDYMLYTMSINETITIMLLSFLLFRFFDIFKPWPISFFDNQENSFSVLFDDVVAGFFSAIFVSGYISWIYLL